jgi:hypothetical protein
MDLKSLKRHPNGCKRTIENPKKIRESQKIFFFLKDQRSEGSLPLN